MKRKKMSIFLNGNKFQIIILCLNLINCSTSKSEVENYEVEFHNDEKYNNLNEEKCSKKREGCCQDMEFGDEEVLMKCITLHQSKIPVEEENATVKSMKFITCLIECLFKQHKISGNDGTINMNMVNLYAEKKYTNRPKEKKYFIDTFERCRQEGLTSYNIARKTSNGKAMLKDACNPYFSFVFFCRYNYQKDVSCPYFKWNGQSETPSGIDCEKAKQKCYQVDGITI